MPKPSRQGITKKNFVLVASIRAVALGLTVLVPIVAARVFDQGSVGDLMFALAVATILAVGLQVGFPWTISRAVGLVRAGTMPSSLIGRHIIRSSAWLSAAGAVLAALALVVDSQSWVHFGVTGSLCVIVIGVLRALARNLSEVNKGFGGVNVAAVTSELIGPSVGLIIALVLVAVRTSATPSDFLVGLACGWVVAGIIAIAVLPYARLSFTGHRIVDAAGAGVLTLGLISALNVGIQQAHILLAGTFLDPNDAGTFSVTARLATLAGAPLMIIAGLAGPDLGVALNSSDQALRQRVEGRLQRVTTALFLAGCSLVLVYVIAGGLVLKRFFGPAYGSGHVDLVVLSIGPLISLFAGTAGLALTLAGAHRRLLSLTAVGSVLAMIMMTLGAWTAGSHGLALGYALGQSFINMLLLRECRKTLGFTPAASLAALTGRRGGGSPRSWAA